MNIFKQIKSNIYDKEYYNTTVLNESLGDSIKYLFKIAAIIAIAFMVVFSFAIPFMLRSLKGTLNEGLIAYPNDLIVNINNGTASINQPEPYFIKATDSIKKMDSSQEKSKQLGIENLAVINTTESFNLDKFKSYKTLVLITKNEIVMMSNNGEIKIENLSIFGNAQITKTFLQDKVNKLYNILPWLLVVLLILVFVGMMLVEFVGTLIATFVYALIAFGLLKLKGFNFDYKKTYQIAIHASTLILFLGIFIKGWNGFLLKVLVFIIIVYFNFDNLNKLEPKKEEIAEIIPDESNN